MSDPKLQIRAVAAIAEVFIFVVMVLLLYWAACNGNGSVDLLYLTSMACHHFVGQSASFSFSKAWSDIYVMLTVYFSGLSFFIVYFLYTCATYWHSCDMHFVSRASHLAISYCIRVYHGLDAHVALCLSLRHEIMMQMRPSFPSANGVSREQFASHEKEANTRRHAAGGSATNICARPACSSQSKAFWMRRDSI